MAVTKMLEITLYQVTLHLDQVKISAIGWEKVCIFGKIITKEHYIMHKIHLQNLQ